MSKIEFEMTQDEYNELIESMKVEPVIKIGSVITGMDRQERANNAWISFGKKRGFDGMTVEPSDRGQLYFLAEPIKIEEECS